MSELVLVRLIRKRRTALSASEERSWEFSSQSSLSRITWAS